MYKLFEKLLAFYMNNAKSPHKRYLNVVNLKCNKHSTKNEAFH